MSIGETLFRARRDAGLSIGEVSSRTQIRLSVIDDIEHDDYSACGGDRHARDTITAIARAVGIDAEPLIEAYKVARQPGGWIAATQSSEPTGVVEVPEPEAFTLQAEVPEPEPATAEDTQPIAIRPLSQPVTVGEPPPPLPIGEPPTPVTPVWTAIPAGSSWPTPRAAADRLPFIWIALGGALLLFALLAGILLLTGTSDQATRHVVVAGRRDIGGRGAKHVARTPSPSHSARSPRPTRSASPAHARGHVRALVPASIKAFGPGGTGQGDSPQLAHQALAGKAAAPWHSAWYTTAHFGNLQRGTGLLLDMGRPVTITSARIALGNHPGTDLALRIGNSPTLASLPPAAHANGVQGVVSLKTAPTRGRYVLVWFTRLPPDQAGTFQVTVYDIKLQGRA